MIRLITAIDNKRGVAKDGKMPWHIPDELAYFAEKTKSLGGNILVGSSTFHSSFNNKPLKDRTNYVLTHDADEIEGVRLVNDLDSWLEKREVDDLWVVGGASVYKQFIDSDNADELYITQIDEDFNCDQFFPEYEGKFHLVSMSEPMEQNGFKYLLTIYAKNS